MIKGFKYICTVCAFLVAFAMAGVTAKGYDFEAGIVFKDNEVMYTPATQIFMDHKDMLPGDVYNNNLIISNESTQVYDLYLQMTLPKNTEDGDKLLDLLEMNILSDGVLIYSGGVRGDEIYNGNSFKVRYLLGTFDPDTNSEITVSVKVSDELSKENLNSSAMTEWKLLASGYENDVGHEEDDDDIDGEVGNEETEIKPGINPTTGDESNKSLFILAIIFSLGGLLWVVISEKKKIKV